MKEVSVIGIDLAKGSFSVCEMLRSGKVVSRKTLSRKALIELAVNTPPKLVAFEACGGSHYWGRLFMQHGHRVKMMQVQRVKSFAPSHKKNDSSDAEAICLAALNEAVPSIKIKSTEQQDIDMVLNFRAQLVKQKVALLNQAHALALEYGVALPKAMSTSYLERLIGELEDANNALTSIARELIQILITQAKALEKQIEKLAKQLNHLMKGNENFKLLQTIPGVGPLTAISILAQTCGDISSFKNGRQFAAYLGLTPRQYSTGGKTKLGRITRCGQSMIRGFLVNGANAVLRTAELKRDRVEQWVLEKKKSLGYRKASVAVANKTARIIYAVLKTQQPYAVAA